VQDGREGRGGVAGRRGVFGDRLGVNLDAIDSQTPHVSVIVSVEGGSVLKGGESSVLVGERLFAEEGRVVGY